MMRSSYHNRMRPVAHRALEPKHARYDQVGMGHSHTNKSSSRKSVTTSTKTAEAAPEAIMPNHDAKRAGNYEKFSMWKQQKKNEPQSQVQNTQMDEGVRSGLTRG